MSRRVIRKVAIACGAALLICLAILVVPRQRSYKEGAAAADSPEAQEALELLRRLASNPRGAPGYMSAEATERARRGVTAAAVQMSTAQSVDLTEAAWFGQYLRVAVTCRTEDGRSIEKRFFLKEEDGKLRITGPAD